MKTIWKTMVFAAVLAAVHFSLSPFAAQAQMSGLAHTVGTVQTIDGTNLTVKTTAGVTKVAVQDGAKLLRIEPGQTNLTNAVPIQLTDVQVGDNVLVYGVVVNDTFAASTLIAIKKADVAAKQQQDLQDWTRRGTGGLVATVDPAAGTVTMKVGTGGVSKNVTVQTSKTTQILRYSADSVKFDDAKPSTLDAIKPGDQLLARGTRSADGDSVTADALVSGNFRNLSGTIASINQGDKSLTLKDVATKMTFTVKVTPDTTIRKLSTQEANMLAARLKATNGAGANGAAGNAAAPAQGGDQGGGRGYGRGGGRFGGGGGGGDLSQVVARAPTATLADLQKGDALMIVSTSGNGSGDVSAIQLVAGVEPILEASPNAGMNLGAWDVGGGGGGGEE